MAYLPYYVNGSSKRGHHQHENPDGTLGGWVQNSARVHPTAYIAPTATVGGSARVCTKARILDHAHVADWVIIGKGCVVFGEALVRHHARLFPKSQVGGQSMILMNARVNFELVVDGKASDDKFFNPENRVGQPQGIYRRQPAK